MQLFNPVSHFDRSTTTDGSGKFSFPNVPFNPYHLSVTGAGFAPYAQDVKIRSAVPLDIKISLKVTGSSESITVEPGGDLLEVTPTEHTDVDRGLFDKLPWRANPHPSAHLSRWHPPASRRIRTASSMASWTT